METFKLLAPNRVLIKIVEKNVDRKTPSGIIMISDTDWQPADHADRYGVIVQLPAALKRERSHLWETSCEVLPGDTCWFDVMISENTDKIITETTEYILLDYFSLHIVKRGDDIICLNGYALFSPMKEETTSNIISINEDKYDARYGVLKHKGSVNTYLHGGLKDDENIQVGDICIFKSQPVMLESEYHARLKDQYRISQLHNVVGYIRDGKLSPTINHVVVEPIMTFQTPSGIFLPNVKKADALGKVISSGCKEIHEGDTINYHHGSATKIEFEGKKHIIYSEYINYYES
jgi:co-chaperonin GroES (HSP10)